MRALFFKTSVIPHVIPHVIPLAILPAILPVMGHVMGHVLVVGTNMDYYSNIRWVDEYIKNLGHCIYVREMDNLLIKIPNEAYKLNPQGVKILKHLLKGDSVYSIINSYPEKEKIARDIHYFFCDLRAVLKGCYNEREQRHAIEKIPFRLPFNTLPVLSEIALTYRCNLACRFCYANCGCTTDIPKRVKMKNAGDTKRNLLCVGLRRSLRNNTNELDTQGIKDVLYIIKNDAMVPSVSFTGGEPTLRKDLPDLIIYAKSLGMWTNLITNGTLIKRGEAKTLKKAGLDSAQVSLEGGIPLIHDNIVRMPGAFLLTVQGIKNLKDSGIRVHTNTTISRLNREYLFGIVDLVKKLGMERLSMNMLMPQGAALEDLEEVLITYSEIGGIILKVHEYARENEIEFMWYSPTPMCIFNPIVHGLGNKGCAACDGLLSICPNGDILPCSSFPKSMGNILRIKDRFTQIWRGREFEFFQKKMFAHPICQRCADLPVCNGGCPLYWKQVGYKEIVKNSGEVRGEIFH